MIIPNTYRKEIAELEEKIDNGFASEKDILRLQEIWRNIIEEENNNENTKANIRNSKIS